MRGERLVRTGSINRECMSVGIPQDLSGFQYGPQLNIARENFTASMTDCLDTPPWAPKFDDQIHVMDKKSTYLLMSKSEKGVQTADTYSDITPS